MIYSIMGVIESLGDDSLVVSVGGFLSLEINVPRANQMIVGKTIKLFTHLQVKEDAFVLFGFLTQEELSWFRNLISIPGIGAKTSLHLLSTFGIHELLEMIRLERIQELTKANGIGTATAKKIILFMHEKLKKKLIQSEDTNCKFPEAFLEAHHILIDLGLTSREASDLLNEIKKEDPTICEEPQTLVKEALKKRGH